MVRSSLSIAAVLVVAITACTPGATSPSPPTPTPSPTAGVAFVPFDDFLAGARDATFDDFSSREGTAVTDEAAFEDMKAHVLLMYDGAEVVGSFVSDGQTFDCITIETQPSVRLGDIREIATAPVGSTGDEAAGGEAPGDGVSLESPLKEGLTDPFGNAIDCADGSIPMDRITLDELVRFDSLASFFSKDGLGGGEVPTEQLPEEGSTVHKYAYAWDGLTNFGGNSWLNLWNPSVADHDEFSLSQQWYTGGDDADTQTVEGGWQVYNKKYGNDNARLFIFWTADDYGTQKCYNLDCTAFVQINSHWYLGGPWTNYSSAGGTQWGFEMQWKLFRGNWWLFLKGPGAYEAVGYYPGSLYGSGQMSKSADTLLYGGEVTGSSSWPQMGSGEFADQGWRRAAYQRTIFSIPRDEDDGVGVWADLTAVQPSPKCYTIDLVPASDGGSWGTYFFFGGPGGTTCE